MIDKCSPISLSFFGGALLVDLFLQLSRLEICLEIHFKILYQICQEEWDIGR